MEIVGELRAGMIGVNTGSYFIIRLNFCEAHV
jgi:hypothetical protein